MPFTFSFAKAFFFYVLSFIWNSQKWPISQNIWCLIKTQLKKKTASNQFFKGVVHEQPWSSIVCLLWWSSIVSSFFLEVFFSKIILSFPFPLLICFSFSRMRSKGSRFTLGVWGLRVCSLDVAFTSATVRNRPQPSATVRKRSQPSAWGPYVVSSAEGVIFGGFTCQWRCFLSRGRRGTLWHSDVFCSVSKVVLCGRRNIFATFSEDAMQQHFGRVHRHFAWQAQHFRRVLCVFFANRIGRAKWRQGADSVAGVAFCEMCWKLTEASHETSILR